MILRGRAENRTVFNRVGQPIPAGSLRGLHGKSGISISSPTQLPNLASWWKADGDVYQLETQTGDVTTYGSDSAVFGVGTSFGSLAINDFIYIEGAGLFQISYITDNENLSVYGTPAAVTNAVFSKLTAATDLATVYRWNDQQAVRDATQTTAAKRPEFRTNIQNGLPGIYFDGVDDCLHAAVGTGTAATLFVLIQPMAYTWSAVSTKDGTGTWAYSNTGYLQTFRDARINGYPTNIDLGVQLWSIVSSATEYRIRKNGVDLTTQSPDFSLGTEMLIGCRTFSSTPTDHFTGPMHEIIYCNSALPRAYVLACERYLEDKWY